MNRQLYVFSNRTCLERIVLSAFTAAFVSSGLLLLWVRLGLSLDWSPAAQRLFAPFLYIFIIQMLNFLIAKHNGAIRITASAVEISDIRNDSWVTVALLINMVIGTFACFVYCIRPALLTAFIVLASIAILLSYEEYCRTMRFRRILSLSDIRDLKIERRRRRYFVFARYKNEWISLPYYRHAEHLVEVIRRALPDRDDRPSL